MPATVDLTYPIFTDLEKAREHFEAIRWPRGCCCPFCGSFDRVAPLGGKSMGPGWYHCKDCRKKFTAAVGTIYERSHIPMTKWLLATHLMCASKKGMSAYQLHHMIGLPYKTAWFMCHRIREGMRDLKPAGPLGGSGKTVEFDETYVGGKEPNKHRSKRTKGNIGGVANVTAKTLRPIVDEQIAEATKKMSDDGGARARNGNPLHQSVNTIGEYVRGHVQTNTIEGYFSIMKRGITRVYHHVSPQHLKRYRVEYDFRYNERMELNVTDAERTAKAVAGVVGKRVTYYRPNVRSNQIPL